MQYFIEKMHLTDSRFFECLTTSSDAPSAMCQAHIHHWVEILYCRSGRMEVILNGKKYDFLSHDLLIIPSHEVHQITALTEEHHEYFVLKFDPNVMNTSMQLQSEYRCILPFLLPGDRHQRLFTARELEASPIPELIAHFSEEYRQMEYGYEIALKADFYNLILWILRRWHVLEPGSEKQFTSKQYEQLQMVFDYVAENYASPISVSTMAELCHISYSYFSKLFARLTGQSFVDYLNLVRLTAAERLLITTEMNVTEVAYATGFSDLSYFTRRFTAKNGVPPREYRELYR